MKKVIINSTTGITFALISSIIILTAGCGNNKPKIQKDTPFAFIPYDCKVIGKINVASILKIEGVSKHIDENKDLPYMKEIKATGFDISNIESVIFGIELNSPQKSITVPNNPTSDGIIIVNAKSKANVADFIKIAKNNNKGIKFKVIKIENKTAYLLPAEKNNAQTYIVQLNDKLIAIGTQKDITKSINLLSNKGESILEDAQIMKLSKNTDMPDMLWITAVVPVGFVPKTDKNTPNLKDGVISINYLNNCLKINGIINCAAKEDAQKILLPFQVASTLIAMNSNNTVKPEDISIKTDNRALSFDINLSKEALKILFIKNNRKTDKGKVSSNKTSDLSKEDVLIENTQQAPTTAISIDTNNTSKE